MDARLVLEPFLIAVLVVVQVGLWQYRMALATRGAKTGASVLAGFDAVLWVTVLGQVLTHLDRPGNVAGYAAGVVAGVYLGCLADERTAHEVLEYRVVMAGDGATVLAGLRHAGWPATAQEAAGLAGPASVIFVAVDAHRASRLEADLAGLAPGTFWTCTRLRSATRVALPAGYLGLHANRMHRRRRSSTAPRR